MIIFRQYSNDYLYDDEYDDRFDDDVPIKIADNPIEEEILTCNPNHEDLASDTSYSTDEEYDDNGKPMSKSESSGKSNSTTNTRYYVKFDLLWERFANFIFLNLFFFEI